MADQFSKDLMETEKERYRARGNSWDPLPPESLWTDLTSGAPFDTLLSDVGIRKDVPSAGQMLVEPADPDWADLTARQEPPPAEFAPAAPPTPDQGGVPLPVEGVGIAGGAGAGAVAGAFVGGPVGAVVGGVLGASAAAIVGSGPKVGTAAMRLDNPVTQVINYLAAPTFPPDPTYDVSTDPDVIGPTSKYSPYLDQFVDSQSEAQTQSIMAHIDQVQQDDKTTADAGFMGVLARLAAGNLSPLTLLPVGRLFSEGVTGLGILGRGINVARGVAEGAVVGGATLGTQEALLHAVDPVAHPLDSSIQDTIVGAALSGIVGGLAH